LTEQLQNGEKTPNEKVNKSSISPDCQGGISEREGKSSLSIVWERLNQFGLGEASLRVGSGLSLIVLVLLVLWVMGRFYLSGNNSTDIQDFSVEAASVVEVQATFAVPPMDDFKGGAYRDGVIRLAQIHTNIPTRPRFDVVTYRVETGDTIFGIAEKFNLEPQTILWANYEVLLDNPHYLSPDMIINILPVNGVYYQWHAGDGLNSVSSYFGVTPEDIINFEGNHLSTETIGDYSNPNIEPGTWLVVPGGEREFITWSALRISRSDPAVAKIYGSGYCGEVMDGPIGTGTYVWPTTETYISGYDYSPGTNHFGIDIGGRTGNAIYGIDSGVVVYAGWNDRGYGNVIVIDHGNGWQSLYAHLDSLKVVCGSYVYQGDVIGLMGSTGNSTGPHLHFEMLNEELGKVNPLNFVSP